MIWVRSRRHQLCIMTLLGVITLGSTGVLGEFTPAAASTLRSSAASSVRETPFTPILMQSVYPPSALTGSDGQRHLAYEVLLTNGSPRPASITGLTVRAGSSNGPVLQVLDASAVKAIMALFLDLSGTRSNSLPSYSTAELVLDTTIPKSEPTPSMLSLRLSATFQPPLPGQAPAVSIFPDSVSEYLPAIAVSRDRPVMLSEPLTGGDWLDANACCTFNAHRGAVFGAAGRPVSGERYAIDFIRIDHQVRLYRPGSPPTMATNYSYGAHLLAVAGGTVVAVQDGLPDQPPNAKPAGLTLNEMGGNDVVVRIHPGVYAFYAHIPPGKVSVHVGQRVHTGQVIGELGNSGNSNNPHLHFQLMDGPSPLTSQGLPFEFRSFTLLANARDNGSSAPPDLVSLHPAPVLHHAYPLENTVIGFPGGSSVPVQTEPVPPPESSGPDG